MLMTTYDVRRSSYCGETYATDMANPSAHTAMTGVVNGCQDDMDVRHRQLDSDQDLRDTKPRIHGSGLS